MQWQMWAMMNENYSTQAAKKRRATVSVQRRNGVTMGQRSYGHDPERYPAEDAGAVVQAYLDAGRNYHRAAVMLGERGVKSRRAHLGAGWEASTIKRIVERERPDLRVTAAGPKRTRIVGTHVLSRLLFCPHDGSLLTSQPRNDSKTVNWICRVGHRSPRPADGHACTLPAPHGTCDGLHPRPWIVNEAPLLERVQGATDDVITAFGGSGSSLFAKPPKDIDAMIVGLREQRAGWLRAGVKGLPEAEVDSEVAMIDDRIANLEAGRTTRLILRKGVNWDAPAADVNARLRALWAGIRLEYVPAPETPRNHVHNRTLDLIAVGAYWRDRGMVMESAGTLDDQGTAEERIDPRAEGQPDGSWYLPFEERAR
jgi:hypothetical protein